VSAARYDSTIRQGRSQSSQALQLNNDASSPLFGQWIVGTRQRPSFTNSRDHGLRASLSAQFPLFRKRAKNEFVVGAEWKEKNFTFNGLEYYRVDANGEFVVTGNPADVNFGRILSNEVYSVSRGFTPNPLPNYPEVDSYVSATDGFTYRLDNNNSRTVTNDVAEAAFAVLTTDWFEGQLNTFAGLRHDRLNQEFVTPANPDYDVAKTTYNVGLVYRLTDALGLYAGSSTSFIPNNQFRVTIDNQNLPASTGEGFEAGLKVDMPFWRISGSLAAFELKSDAAVFYSTPQRNLADNESIFNGRYRQRDLAFISDNTTRGIEVALTARPTKNWRLRLSYATIQSIGGTGLTVDRFYNDQIFADSRGQVYFSGNASQLVYVNQNPADVNSPRVPLTLAMLNDPAGAYGVRYNQNNFRIATFGGIALSGNNGIRVYENANTTTFTRGVINRADGRTIGTGVTGLPWTQSQFPINPFGSTAVIQAAGEETTGYSEHSLAFNGVYTFGEGRFKGLRVGGGATLNLGVRGYYYFDATGVRRLYQSPDTVSTHMMLGYSRRLARGDTWGVQVNVNNILDEQEIIFLPNGTTGRIDNARYNQNPRLFRFSASLDF
jgi:outer membrane receptor for ferric coprogen and ferric-rhodotorulic acid